MTDDERDQGETAEETSAPITAESVDVQPISAPGKWEMPKPVFRRSDGFLPEGFAKRYPVADEPVTAEPVASSDGTAAAMAPEATPSVPAATEPAEIQPQPDLEDTLAPVASKPVPQSASASRPLLGMLFGVVGLMIMAVVAVAVLLAVYYFFFYSPGESLNLN
jgi:hypothetical protein